jgi:hypothetical protein
VTLDELPAREGIRKTLTRYNINGDVGNYDEVLKCFIDDAIFEIPVGKWKGRDTISNVLRTMAKVRVGNEWKLSIAASGPVGAAISASGSRKARHWHRLPTSIELTSSPPRPPRLRGATGYAAAAIAARLDGQTVSSSSTCRKRPVAIQVVTE